MKPEEYQPDKDEVFMLFVQVFGGKGSMTGLAKSTGWAMVRDRRIPPPRKIAKNRSGYWSGEARQIVRALTESNS